MGRPTKYKIELLAEVNKYLDKCVDTSIDGNVKVNLPTMQGLALYLNVNRDTLFEWAKVHTEFSDSLDQINNLQAIRLINNGLSGDYNPTIAKLILSANHGMREKTDRTTNNKDLPTPIYGGKSTENLTINLVSYKDLKKNNDQSAIT